MSGLPHLAIPCDEMYMKLANIWNKAQHDHTLHLVKIVDDKGRETYTLPGVDVVTDTCKG